MCRSGGKFLKPWQVTDNIIEWIFFQFTFDPLWMTQTHEIITWRVSNKLMNGYGECVWVGESFIRNYKWQITLLREFFSNSHSTFFSNDSNSKNITRRASKIHECIWRECLWVGESFLRNDKWQIKILSELFSNSHSTFNEWLKLKK